MMCKISLNNTLVIDIVIVIASYSDRVTIFINSLNVLSYYFSSYMLSTDLPLSSISVSVFGVWHIQA